MSDQPNFERRLTAALQRRADGAPISVDAYAVTHIAAAAGTSVGARPFGVPGWRTARLVLVVVLAAVLLAASLVIGSRLVSPAPKLGRLVRAGEMTTARGGPTATLLQDGRVLLAAGQAEGAMGSAELYDPATDAFTATGSLSTLDRVWATSAALPDGRVLIVGGYGQLTPDGDPIAFPFGEIYDPAAGTFGRTGPMIQARPSLWSVVTLPDGRVLIAGDDDDGSADGSVEIFDPDTEAFVAGGSLQAPRSQHTLTLLGDGRVLVVGGWSGDLQAATAEIYDPATGTSVPTGALREARADHTASILADGRVLIVGGTGPGPDYEALVSAELYDPKTGTFTLTGPLTTERSGPAAVTLRDGRVLVVGGHNVDGDPRTIELYDPASGTFDVVGRLAPAQGSGNDGWLSATLLGDGSVLLAGRDIAQAERFVPTLSAEPLDTGAAPVAPVGFVALDGQAQLRTGHTATRLADGRVLVAGGRFGGTGSTLASAEVFDPATGRFTVTGSMAAPRSGHVAVLLPDGRVLILAGLDGADVAISWPSAEMYDPIAGTFSPLGTMTLTSKPARGPLRGPDPAAPTAVALPDGRVLIVGWDPTSAAPSQRSIQVFDPVTGRLTALEVPAGVLARGVRGITLLPDDRVLVLDGNDQALQAEVYDPLADTWELGDATTAREAFATAVLADGQVLLVGGQVGDHSFNDESLATAETWGPTTGEFSAAGDMGAGRTGGTATLLSDGRVLIAGGVDHRHNADGTGPPNEYPAPRLWDPVSRTFDPAGVMAADRSGHTATLLDDGHVLLVGGIARQPDRDEADPPAAELYVGP